MTSFKKSVCRPHYWPPQKCDIICYVKIPQKLRKGCLRLRRGFGCFVQKVMPADLRGNEAERGLKQEWITIVFIFLDCADE